MDLPNNLCVMVKKNGPVWRYLRGLRRLIANCFASSHIMGIAPARLRSIL